MNSRLWLNADVGEGMHGDDLIIQSVDLVNIAGGGHAGGGEILDEAVHLAVQHNKKIGAHPSYPDRISFGRESQWGLISPEELRHSLIVQILAVASSAQKLNTRITHIKPHGALYNDAASDPQIALLIAQAVQEASIELMLEGMPPLPIMMLAGSPGAMSLAKEGVQVISEGFADRRYTSEGVLVSRKEADAVIHDIKEIHQQVEKMWLDGRIMSREGIFIRIDVNTVCVHGDNPDSVSVARYLRNLIDSWEVPR